jgi:hypothetical protein
MLNGDNGEDFGTFLFAWGCAFVGMIFVMYLLTQLGR